MFMPKPALLSAVGSAIVFNSFAFGGDFNAAPSPSPCDFPQIPNPISNFFGNGFEGNNSFNEFSPSHFEFNEAAPFNPAPFNFPRN